MAIIEDFIPWTNTISGTKFVFQKGTKGQDTFNPEGSDKPLIQIGGNGNDFYNVGIPSLEQIEYSLKTGNFWGIMYHGVRPGFGHPEWATYGGKDSITGRFVADNDIGHGGWGTFLNLGKGADDIFVHGNARDQGDLTMTVIFSRQEKDQLFMDNSRRNVEWSQQEALDPNDDGFRFHDVKLHREDNDTIIIDEFEVTSYSRSGTIINQTVKVKLGDSHHGPWQPERVQDDVGGKSELNAALDHLDGWVGDFIL